MMFLFIIHNRPLRVSSQAAALLIVLVSLWLDIFTCRLLVWLFLAITKLQSIQALESDFTSSTSDCGPCWELVAPNEVLVFACAILMAPAPPCFTLGAWDSLFGLFFVTLFLHLPFTQWGQMRWHFLFASIWAQGRVFTFPEGLLSPLAAQEASLGEAKGWLSQKQSCLLFASLTSTGSGCGRRAGWSKWSGLCYWLCCVDSVGVT